MEDRIKAKHTEIEALAHPASSEPPPRPPKPGNIPPPPKKEIRAKVLYKYSAKESDELSLDVGEILRITSKSGDWWEGSIEGKTKVGSFPSNYVELLE